jgi:formate dehydrogenase gamma subunit
MSQHKRTYARFDIWQRLEHGLLAISFTVLSISGLPQKYPDSTWGNAMIQWMGGIESTRVIHHVAAVLLILGAVYHGGVLTYRIFVLRVRPTMLPAWQDVQDGFHALAYNLGLAKTHPKMGRYTFAEKFEYWAVVWGTVIMIITGFVLWNPIATTEFLPGQFVPASKAAHGGEALLAVLAIITWHVYNVHFKFFNKSMFTGRISHREMVEEHPLELEEIESETVVPQPTEAGIRRRQRIFVPVAVIISIVMLSGVYWFITFEQTAITTVPTPDTDVFVPATATPEP